jgi:hypothetical protein
MCTELHEILYTHSQEYPSTTSAVASRYYNCCTDGNTSSRNFGYHLVGELDKNFTPDLPTLTSEY